MCPASFFPLLPGTVLFLAGALGGTARADQTIFPTGLPADHRVGFQAEGFSKPVSGVIHLFVSGGITK